MTDIVKVPPAQAQTALAAAIDNGSGLDLMTLATVMVQSGFFPTAVSVAQGVVKILAGRELGFPAIASMRHIYVHKGHIGLQAILIATKIRKSGTYDYRIVQATDTECAIDFLRKNAEGKWGVEGQASFTMVEAKRAGLVKSDSGWESYPSDMLFARTITRGQRRFCPDVFEQAVYSEEEVRAIAEADPEPKLVGGQTLEERMAEMMPKEKTAPMPPAEDTPTPALAEHAPKPADATPPAAPAPPVVAGDSGSEAAAGVQDSPVSTESNAQPDLPAGQTEKPNKLRFTVGQQKFETNGITRAQMMELFKICPRVGKKCGAEKPAEILRKEFGLEHRVDLTEEQAERYYIRMKEMLEN